jgi:hypothetical protein
MSNTADGIFGPPDDFITSQAEAGRKTYQKQRYGRPQFGFPDISQQGVENDRLLNALLGAGAGAQAAGQMINPFAAGAAGIAAGIGAPQAGDFRAKREAARLSIAEEQLNQAPVGAVAPQMVQALQAKYGMDVSEIPMGQFQKFAGLLQRSDDLEKRLLLMQQRADLQLRNLKEGQAGKVERDVIDEQTAADYEDTLLLPSKLTAGKRMTMARPLIKAAEVNQPRIVSLEASRQLISSLKNRFEALAKSGGQIGRATGAMAGGRLGGAVGAEAASYQADAEGFLGKLKEVVGQSGVLSDRDMQALAKLLPGAGAEMTFGADRFNQMISNIDRQEKALAAGNPIVKEMTALSIGKALAAGQISRDEAKRRLMNIGYTGR